MRKFFLYSFAMIGALIVFGAIALAVIAFVGKEGVPKKTILEVDFEQGVVEVAAEDPLSAFGPAKKPTLRAVLSALERAGDDERVAGLIARVGGNTLGAAQIQEIREAIIAFRAKNKPAVAFAETFGEVAPGNGSYYLATAFDRIYLQPSGDLGFTGLIAEAVFVRGAFDKLGVEPRMDHRYEYKNAKNMFTEKQFTDAHREAMLKITDSIWGQMVRGIAERRQLNEAEVRSLADRGPFNGTEAVAAKLVDRLAYRDEVYAEMKQKAGDGAQLLYLTKYLSRAGSPYDKGQTIALIYGVGDVTRGKSDFSPLFGGQSMGSDTVAAAFRRAVDDKDVKAILFRIDSPGGSYIASDSIWRETVRAREAGKPVIVSMGNVAGSGGYYVAMSADKIVAQPATITGSIGVVGGKFLTHKFWEERLGITFDEVHTNKHSTFYNSGKDYSPEEWKRFQAWMDRIYDDFTTKAAEGRKLPKEKLLAAAKGRIWSGEDAKALGLVDELGGYSVALKLAREAANIPADARIQLKIYPKPKPFLLALLDPGPDSSEPRSGLASTLQRLQPLAKIAAELTADPEAGVLTMPHLGTMQ